MMFPVAVVFVPVATFHVVETPLVTVASFHVDTGGGGVCIVVGVIFLNPLIA